MNVKSVSARGFKNLSLRGVNFHEVTLVMGENGIGKSNLLQLIHCLFQRKEALRTEELQFDLDGLVPDEDLICRGESGGEATVVIGSDLPRFRELCTALGGNAQSATEATLDFRFWRSGGTAFKITGIKVGGNIVFSDADGGPQISEVALPAIHSWLAEEVRDSTIYVPVNRLLARNLVPYSPETSPDAVNDLENTILRLLSDPAAKDEQFDELRKTMSDFFGIQDIRNSLVTRPEPTTEPRKSRERAYRDELGRPMSDIGVGIRIRQKDRQWFDVQRVGSGLQQLLVILTMLYQHEARIALVEEFDSSLSPRLRSDILKHFIQITGSRRMMAQLIATTHAAFEWPPARPHCLGAKLDAKGLASFEAVNDNYLKRHTLPPVMA